MNLKWQDTLRVSNRKAGNLSSHRTRGSSVSRWPPAFFLSVFLRCQAEFFPENRIEMAAVGKAEPLHDIRDAHVSVRQKAGGFFQGEVPPVF